MNKTRIEYLTHTWNPLSMQCTPVSEGCRNCWHLAMAKRLANNYKIDEGVRRAYAGGIPILNNKELKAPFHLRKPARIGVQFMGDLFHQSILRNSVVKILNSAFASYINYGHSFFFLTKRPDRMNDELILWAHMRGLKLSAIEGFWLGISVEDQKTAHERIPILLQIPAAHRWVSVEPMLGPINLRGSSYGPDWLEGWDVEVQCCGQPDPVQVQTEKLDWVVCGGETGPGARPLYPDWALSLKDQCVAAGVPFFFKNWGTANGKRKTHILDGKEWREYPK